MLLVVGGHSRNIGKTAVVCGIIRSLPEANWTAIKITQFGHNICTRHGAPCHCSDPKHPVAVSEEDGSSPLTDSGRFLAAGAGHSFWVRTPAGRLAEALPDIRGILAGAGNVIVESNSLLQFLKPERYLMVVDGAVEDFKLTSLRFLDRADALVATSAAPLAWPSVPVGLLRGKQVYRADAPLYESAELSSLVRSLVKRPRVERFADSHKEGD